MIPATSSQPSEAGSAIVRASSARPAAHAQNEGGYAGNERTQTGSPLPAAMREKGIEP